MIYDPTITVCSKCLRACCWQGEFMCDESFDASTVPRKVSTLLRISGEHPDYWNEDLWMGNRKLLTAEDLKTLGAKGDQLELKKFTDE